MASRKGKAAVEKKAQALEQLTIEYVPRASVRPNAYNPNRQSEHEFTLLCRSIEEDGFTQPIIVASDDIIVDGEHRWRAAEHLGIDPIPIVRVPMGYEQARIATLRHNRARGSEDVELSVAVLRDLEALGALDWAAESLDLTDAELQRLLDDIPAPEALAADEYSTAWEPGHVGEAGRSDANVGEDSTPTAATNQREAEARLREAKSDEERQAILADRDVYRLTLNFTGEEAQLVRATLGDAPAQTLLAMCRAQ